MAAKIAKIAVSAATYSIDKPYDYLIPGELLDKALPGTRVYVPFSRGNRRSEGIILAVEESSSLEKLKTIQAVLDDEPVLKPWQLKLALFMRERYFCTVYDAARALLPAGLWLKEDGQRRVNDKTVEMARLAISPEDADVIAENKRRRSPMQAELLSSLCGFEALPSQDLMRHTGASRQSLKALCKAGLVELFYLEVYRRPESSTVESLPMPELNDAQQRAFEGLNALAMEDKSAAALLFGVTGSGKTSVYMHLISRQLALGKSAILLVPEIALTPQMLSTFAARFGDNIAVQHSSLSVGERYDEYKRIRDGKARLVIGTRSAVFAPAENLGLIIIDEEQEESYRSENNPRYSAREIAKYRCYKSNALLLLGSATPDIQSRYLAKTGKYAYFSLPNRYNERSMPKVKVADMKKELRRGNGGNISSFLREELEKNIENGEQSILLINRRGANRLISCGECGFTFRCPRCSVSLTYHSNNNRLICHHCGFSRRLPEGCPECGGEFKFVGAGTQLVEQELNELFPGVPVLRVDTDTVSPAGSHERLFEKFRNENIPIMVGTQMVAKGLNFDNVTLVGVVSADQSLYAGDYRAGERTFSLITQVIGRSGRASKEGRAVIQTFTPDNETLIQAARQDYEAFYCSEIELRRLQNSPPFTDALAITASGQDEMQVINACRFAKQLLDNAPARCGISTLGPTPLAVVKVNNRYRYRINISCKANNEVRACIADAVIKCSRDSRFKGVSIFADNDPLD